jgi:hypothetical protein
MTRLARLDRSRIRAATLLAVAAIVIGVLCFVNARGQPFALSGGVRLWRLIHMSQLGAVVVVAFGALALIGARRASAALTLVAGVLYAVAGLFTLVTLGTAAGVLGGRADTLVLFFVEGVGLITLATVSEPAGGRE